MSTEKQTDFIHTCDCCSSTTTTKTGQRPKHWTELVQNRDAYDLHNNACADASINLDLCNTCSDRIIKAINKIKESHL